MYYSRVSALSYSEVYFTVSSLASSNPNFMTCNPFDADSDYEDHRSNRRPSSSSSRRVSFTEPIRGSIVLDGRRGSLFSIPEVNEKERGSIFALFDDPFG